MKENGAEKAKRRWEEVRSGLPRPLRHGQARESIPEMDYFPLHVLSIFG